MKMFGEDVMEGVSEAWGLDDEAEVRGCFRPTGHPGVSIASKMRLDITHDNLQLWFAIGDFAVTRMLSKQLVCLSPYTTIVSILTVDVGDLAQGKSAWAVQAGVPFKRDSARPYCRPRPCQALDMSCRTIRFHFCDLQLNIYDFPTLPCL